MEIKAVQKLISDQAIKFVDLRFSDTLGKEHHVTIPVKSLNEDLIKNGQPFDGSSIHGWRGIENSDMLLKPDLSTAKIDPFYETPTLFVTCDVIDTLTGQTYIKCPRGIAKRAEEFLISSGIGSAAYFGPEPDFLFLILLLGELTMVVLM